MRGGCLHGHERDQAHRRSRRRASSTIRYSKPKPAPPILRPSLRTRSIIMRRITRERLVHRRRHFHCEGAGNCTSKNERRMDCRGERRATRHHHAGEPQSGRFLQAGISPRGCSGRGAWSRPSGVSGEDDPRRRVPPATYSKCIVTKEWTVLEHGSIEFKTYCPNIGMVQTVRSITARSSGRS